MNNTENYKYRLLVVDDAPYFLALVRHAFTHNYVVYTVESGAAALAFLTSQPLPDLILLDVEMPVMNGYEVCRTIKANTNWAEIPIIFVTGKNNAEAEMEGLSIGAIDYIAKPIDLHILRLRINNLLSREHLRSTLLAQRERLQAELMLAQKRRQRLELAASVFENSREGIVIFNIHGQIVDANQACCELSGFSLSQLLGRSLLQFKNGRHGDGFYSEIIHSIKHKGHWYGDIWLGCKNGSFILIFIIINVVKESEPSSYIAMFMDVTQRRQHEQQILQAAYYDLLTALPNRKLMFDRLRQAMLHAERIQQLIAVAFIDLDGFKAVNDSFGHKVGDQLLVMLAQRMKEALRESDTLARLGGDEFVAILVDLESHESIQPIIQRLLSAVAAPVEINGHLIQVSASIGLSFYPQAEDADADQLVRQADQAMYQAKQSGKNNCHLFNAKVDSHIHGYYETMESVRDALNRQALEIRYQPRYYLHGNERNNPVISVEAVLYWHHPHHGVLTANQFLAALENTAFMIELDQWCLSQVISQLAMWCSQGLQVQVSLNVSAYYLQHPRFMTQLKKIFENYPVVKSSQLQLEIDEKSLLENIENISHVIHSCAALDIEIILDNFGRGYSGLSWFRYLPIFTITIDEALLQEATEDENTRLFLQAVCTLMRTLGRRVLLKGVFSAAQWSILQPLAVSALQGEWVASPLSAAALPEWEASTLPLAGVV